MKHLEESNARLSTENAAPMAEIANLKFRIRGPSPSLTQSPSPSISAGSNVSFVASSGHSITDFMSSMPSTSAPVPPAVTMFRPKLRLTPLRLLYPPHVRHEIGTTLQTPRRSLAPL
ncbi:hypothetical protein EHS25_001921 [Saitozyma podzolica]|uniref:Uncharacterized protein n=1 Tax=Saitozyma podzolica TaxID=1890683 RepID=A0A427YFH7_9TREE|nr:hypothetical protein EHS25_001921 [Saitozyma podzolica]